MYDHAWKFLDNKRDMRCWMTEKAEFFESLGYRIMAYPDFTKYQTSEEMFGDSEPVSEHPSYRLLDGTEFILADGMR